MARPTYRVDFSRTDDHGHVIVSTVTAGDQVTMTDGGGTSCLGTVVLHSPDLGILLVRPDPETWEKAVVVDEETCPRPVLPARERDVRSSQHFPLTGARRV